MRASQPVSSNIDSDAASNADNSISADNRGTRVVDTQAYTASEIDRVTRVALDLAHKDARSNFAPFIRSDFPNWTA